MANLRPTITPETTRAVVARSAGGRAVYLVQAGILYCDCGGVVEYEVPTLPVREMGPAGIVRAFVRSGNAGSLACAHIEQVLRRGEVCWRLAGGELYPVFRFIDTSTEVIVRPLVTVESETSGITSIIKRIIRDTLDGAPYDAVYTTEFAQRLTELLAREGWHIVHADDMKTIKASRPKPMGIPDRLIEIDDE